MLRIALLSSLGVALMVALGDAFSSPCAFFSLHRSARLERNSYYARNPIIVMAVSDVSNEESFDTIIKDAKGSLVVIDYSTTWCGPCKVIAPKFDELSDKYPQAKFLKVIGDASPEASKLMKREGVRSVPSFHYFKNGEKVDVVNGANAAAIEAAITKHL